jgi:enolase
MTLCCRVQGPERSGEYITEADASLTVASQTGVIKTGSLADEKKDTTD